MIHVTWCQLYNGMPLVSIRLISVCRLDYEVEDDLPHLSHPIIAPRLKGDEYLCRSSYGVRPFGLSLSEPMLIISGNRTSNLFGIF